MRSYHKDYKTKAARGRNRKLLLTAVFAVFAFAAALTACDALVRQMPPVTTAPPTATVPPTLSPSADMTQYFSFTRTTSPAAFDGIVYEEWNVPAGTVSRREKRDFTLLVYMNGSDLESESGAATRDLHELIEASEKSAKNVNVVVLTGGANRWITPKISPNTCTISEIADGKLQKLAEIGLKNMGGAGTLASFLKFGYEYFPAENTAVILWDHGGGSIAGYGYDEHFEDSGDSGGDADTVNRYDGTMSLTELEYAFFKAELPEKLAFVGFDACLMASVEMAVVLEPYAGLLLASESLEPENGWDYTVLRGFFRGKMTGGMEIAKLLAEGFYASERYGASDVTISVVDLTKVTGIMGALDRLAARLNSDIKDTEKADAILQSRAAVSTFGDGSPADNMCDMADALDFAEKLGGGYAYEAAAVRRAVREAVVLSRTNSRDAVCGLSVYSLFGGIKDAPILLEVYESLAMGGAFTQLQKNMYTALGSTNSAPEPVPGVPVTLFGRKTEMYEIARPESGTVYAAPAIIDGELADIIVYKPVKGSMRVLGYRREEGYVQQKGYTEFSEDAEVVPTWAQ
ncbi:MAG: hypothetical protein LBO63_01985 [Oscillospiraceae bacterium]|jgi:hypothetical protein|nr:hypothetical protein [Oscillospiraceae bacterium]